MKGGRCPAGGVTEYTQRTIRNEVDGDRDERSRGMSLELESHMDPVATVQEIGGCAGVVGDHTVDVVDGFDSRIFRAVGSANSTVKGLEKRTVILVSLEYRGEIPFLALSQSKFLGQLEKTKSISLYPSPGGKSGRKERNSHHVDEHNTAFPQELEAFLIVAGVVGLVSIDEGKIKGFFSSTGQETV